MKTVLLWSLGAALFLAMSADSRPSPFRWGRKGDDEEKQLAAVNVPSRTDHWRPQIHFSPQKNWLNDPNGLFRDSKGVWHLYYQYGHSCWPDAIKDWGHATSPDLYTWTDQRVAIPATAKEGSIWSGSVVVDKNNTSSLFPATGDGGQSSDDNVVAYFTSWTPHEEAQYMAYSLDGGYTFTPYAANPIISLDRHQFRDPKVIFHKASGRWVMTLTLERGVTFYTSTNLRDWTRASTWMPRAYLGMIECPQLIEIPRRRADGTVVGSAYLLTLSLANGGPHYARSAVKYIVGDFDGASFHPLVKPGGESEEDFVARDIDFGPDIYATAFFHFLDGDDAHNNAVSISWATSLGYAMETPTPRDGWRHCMGGAREHWLSDEDGTLVSVPVAMSKLHLGAGGGRPDDGGDGGHDHIGFDPLLVSRERVAGLQVDFPRALRDMNPPLELVWTVHVPKLQTGEMRAAELKLEAPETGEFVALQFDIAGPEPDDADEPGDELLDFDLIDLSDGESGDDGQKKIKKPSKPKPKRPAGRLPTATFTMRRAGMGSWRVDSYALPGVRALAGADDSGRPHLGLGDNSPDRRVSSALTAAEPDEDGASRFTVRAVFDRSILEAYVNGGSAAGTLLYFADGVLDRLTVRSVDDVGAPKKSSSSSSHGGGRYVDVEKAAHNIENNKTSGLRFDVRAIALRSCWRGQNGGTSDNDDGGPNPPPPRKGVPADGDDDDDDGRGREL